MWTAIFSMLGSALWMIFLAFVQNSSFSVVSRSRNRDNLTYHLFASVVSNTLWFITMKALVTHDMTWALMVPYTIGTVSGSLCGVKISMWIERWLGAESDSHLKKTEEKKNESDRVSRTDISPGGESGRVPVTTCVPG